MAQNRYFVCQTCGDCCPCLTGTRNVKVNRFCPLCSFGNTNIQMLEVDFPTYAKAKLKAQVKKTTAYAQAQAHKQANSIYGNVRSQNVSPQGAKCKIWWDNDIGAYYVSTPYSKEFVDFIKIAVPVSDRAYDPTTRHWTVSEKWLDTIQTTAQRVWKLPGEVVVITKAQTQTASMPPPVKNASLDAIFIDFCKLLSFDELNAAYRKAAQRFHPDTGGDMEQMTRLNELFNRIKQEKQK